MALVALKCPHCGGDIQLDDAKEFGFCMHCGTKVMLQENITQKIKVDYSSEVATLVEVLWDHIFSYDLTSTANLAQQVLSMDPQCWEGWWGKGLSTFDASERAVYFKNAHRLCSDPNMQCVIQDLAENYACILVPSSELLINYGAQGFINGHCFTFTDFGAVLCFVKKGKTIIRLGKKTRVFDVNYDGYLRYEYTDGFTELYVSNFQLYPSMPSPMWNFSKFGYLVIDRVKLYLDDTAGLINCIAIENCWAEVYYEDGKPYIEASYGENMIELREKPGSFKNVKKLFLDFPQPGILSIKKEMVKKEKKSLFSKKNAEVEDVVITYTPIEKPSDTSK